MKLRLPIKLQAALIATLASAALTTLSSATAYAQDTPATSDGDAGKVLFMGDSITNGYFDMTHRWQLFKIFVDNGVVFDIDGPLSGYTSSAMPSANYNPDYGTAYRGKAFENVHYAKSSGRSSEMINGTSRYEGVSIAQVGQTNYDTYSLLIGTNDLLSDKGYTYDNFKTKMQNLLGGTVSYSGTGTDAEWSWAPGDTPGGNLNTIVDALNLNQGDEFLVLSIPVWTTHGNNNEATTHAAVGAYNKLLQQWVTNYNSREDAATTIKYVDVNQGILDLTSTTPFFGNKSFFNNGNDGLHPSNQGSLIMAGNEARAMGIGGRTAGLHRSGTDGEDWTKAQGAITLHVGDEAQTVTDAAFTVENGYTVDFTATFGNGSADGWLDADKDRPASGVAKVTTFSTLDDSLNITVGDGTHTGTLKLAEGYVAWSAGNGDMVLYCQNNAVSGNENLRIAYRDADSANNILGGYYVWKGDMLIGQGLAASGGSDFNGIQVSITGNASTGGTVSGISWANTAYAPTTNLFSQEPLPSHDNPNPQGIKEDITWTPTEDKFALPGGQSSTEGTIYKEISTAIGRNYTGAANANYTGNIGMHYTGTENLDAKQSILSVWNATVTGDVYILLDNPNTVYDSFTTQAGQYTSMVATWGGNITGKYTATINAGILPYNVYGGAHTGNNSHIDGGSYTYINGGQFGENVYGGGRVASATISQGTYVTVTGGAISGSVYGGGVDGTITGGSHVTVTGGTIAGSVYGGGSGGTIEGGTSVTVDGNLPYIGGDIVADTVTLQNVAPDSEHADTFDKYRGNIRADKVVLDHYTVEHLLAGVETKSLVLSGGSSTTVSNLTLTACDIHVDADSTLTLEGVNTYGNTATYNGHVAIADHTTFTLHTATMSGAASGYSDGLNGFAKGTMIVLQQTPAEDEEAVAGTGLYGTDGNTLTSTTTDTLIGGGILTGASFSYNAETGQLTAEALGTGGPYFVNEGTVVYNSSSTAYQADDIRLNGGTLQFQEELKDGTALSVIKEGSGIIVDNGVSLAVNRVDAASLAEFGVTLSGTMTASTRDELLSKLTGAEAGITTTANITLNSDDTTVAGGVLTIGDSLNLNLNGNKNNTYNISSFKQIVLGDGSAINYNGRSATFKNVTLADGDASISITDMGANTDMLTLAGETQLNGHRLSITAPDSSWKRFVTIEKLVGDADSTLSFEGGKTDDGSGSKITINSLQGFSGTLELKENRTGNALTATVNTGSGSAVNMKALSLTGTGETVTVLGYAPLTIGTLTVSGGSDLKVEMYGTPSHQLTIGKILGSGTTASTTVELYTSSGNNITANHFILGAEGETYGDDLYAGTVWVTSKTNQGASSRATTDVYLAAQDVLRDATLKLSNWASNYNNTRISLSLGTDAKVAGIAAKDNGNNSGLVNRGSYIRSGSLSVAQPDGIANFVSTSDQAYTLEITGSGTYEADSRILDKVNLHMNGSGTQTFTGNLSNMSYFDGSITVSKGKLVLSPNSTLATHEVSVASGAELTIAPTGSNAITASATMHNEGILNLTGTVKLDTVHMADFDMVEGSAAPVYSGVQRDDIRYENSGYLTTSAQYYLVQGSEGSTLNASVTIDANTGTLVEQTTDPKSVIVTFKTNGEGGMFYVNDSFTYGSDMDAASDISIAKGATLTAANNSALSPGKVLHGEGTYALASQATGLNSGLTLGADWTGSVVLSGPAGTKVANINLQNSAVGAASAVATSNSSIELRGIEGYLKNSGTANLNNANLIMTNPTDRPGVSALKLTDGTSGSVTYLTGSISGSGDFEHAWNRSTVQFELQGNLSQWTGNIIKSQAGITEFTLSNNPGGTIAVGAKGNSGTLNIYVTNNAPVTLTGNFVKGSGTLNVIVKDTTQATFTGTITNANLTVNAGASATMATDATITGITNSGTVAVTGGHSLQLNASANPSLGNVELDGSSLKLASMGGTRTYSVTSLKVSGDSHINHLEGGGSYYNGLLNITSLTSAEGQDAALSIGNAARHNAFFANIDGGSFNGTLTVMGEAVNGTRRTAVQLNDENVAAGAVVKFDVLQGQAARNVLGLGVGAENVNILGITTVNAPSGAYIYSGKRTNTSGYNSDFDSVDTSYRTLTIGGDGEYSTSATVRGYLNLVMNGEGTQTFSGDMSAFNGTITVNKGTLALTGTVGQQAGAVAVNGGRLDLGAGVNSVASLAVGASGTLKLSKKGDAAVSATTITLADGAVLDLSTLGIAGTEDSVVLLKGGTVDPANLAGVQVTYGEQDVSKHSVLSVNDSALVLTFASFDLVWDNNTTTRYWTADSNWHSSTDDRHHVRFYNGDDVRFVATTAAPTPILGSNVSVGTMTVDSGVNLTLDTNEHDLTAESLVADGASLTKNGNGTATFSGDAVSLELLAVNGGTAVFNQHVTVTGDTRVNIYGGNATFAQGFTYEGGNGYGLVVGNGTTDASVILGDDSDMGGKLLGVAAKGTLTIEEGVTVTAAGAYNSGTLGSNGTIIVKQGATLNATAGAVNASNLQNAGTITAVGANVQTLTNSGTMVLGGTSLLSDADHAYSNTGTISVVGDSASSLARLDVNNNGETLDLGAISLNNAELHIGSSGESRVRNISTLTVDGTAKLTQQSWNNFIHIDALNDGEGSDARTLTWDVTTNHFSNSILYLEGEGDFDGTFVANRGNAGGNGAYQAHVQIDNGLALQNAVLNVTGYNTGNYMSVALNAANVSLMGLEGNANSILYAGAADATTGRQGAARGSIAPTSGENTSTLTLNVTGDAAHTYSGKVLGGISLVKAGAGTQTFSGDMSAFNGTLTLNEGTLAFTSATTATGLTGVAGTTLSTTANLTVDTAQTSTFAGTLAGTGRFTKDGAGTLTLSAANTISGGVAVNGGTLVANNAGALGTGSVSVTGGNLVINAVMNDHEANSFNNTGGTLTMNDNSKLTMFAKSSTQTYNLGNMVVNGSVGVATKVSGSCFNAKFNITGLTSGSDGSEIELSTGAQYSKATVFDLDTNQTSAFNGTITVKQSNTTTTATRLIALNLTLGEDAQAAEVLKDSVIKLDNVNNSKTIVGLGLNSDVTVKGIDSGTATAQQHVIFAGKASTDDTEFASTNEDVRYTLTVDTNGTDHSTHADVLGKIDLVKKGAGTQVFSGDMSNFNGSVDVEGGELNIMNIAQASSLNVKDVTIAAGATMGVYTNGTAAEANEGTLTMKAGNTLKAGGENATLNANLVMEAGSVLEVSLAQATHGLTMGSTVALNTGDLLGDADLGYVQNLKFGDYYYLYDDVESLSVNGTQYDSLNFKDWTDFDMDASTVYTQLDEKRYALVYRWDGSNVGTIAITLLPEPTTGTLSLLALAALAARRRRK